MSRPSDLPPITESLLPSGGSYPYNSRPKDPMRGVDREKIDNLSDSLTDRLDEIAALSPDRQPVRGAKLKRLRTVVRLMRWTLRKFEEAADLAT